MKNIFLFRIFFEFFAFIFLTLINVTNNNEIFFFKREYIEVLCLNSMNFPRINYYTLANFRVICRMKKLFLCEEKYSNSELNARIGLLSDIHQEVNWTRRK